MALKRAVGFCLRPLRKDARGIKVEDEQKLQANAIEIERTLGLPPIRPLTLLGNHQWHAIYAKPSHAIQVLQWIHESADDFSFSVGIALGSNWIDTIEVLGNSVEPECLSRAKALGNRASAKQSRWVTLDGFGSWDPLGTVVLNLIHCVRIHRNSYRRALVCHLRKFRTIREAWEDQPLGSATRFRSNVGPTGVMDAWRAEALLGEHLDAYLESFPSWP